ncbi:hypothetical protein OG339_39110 [Streptosporangium sp. NBC_01495]|uniref:hypothetical protein n=1 Tax=Streptosporangium sp. NBC_01495 TaxID=2903899 RepID=UPI002E30047D|nr:hypothetical protein [Streptosporangium sp. NBC_01495]
MTAPPEGPTRRRPIAVPLAALVTAAGLGVTAALGGFATAPDTPPKRLGQGSTVDQEQFTTTFVGSRTTSEPGLFGSPAKRFLEIEFRVLNKGDETADMGLPYEGGPPGGGSFGASLLKITPAIKGKYGASVFTPTGGGESSQLHPALPTSVVVRYELEGRQRPPKQLTIDVGKYEWNEGITLAPGWFVVTKDDGGKEKPVVAAQVTLPVVPEGARS